jgi:hypothetical protein
LVGWSTCTWLLVFDWLFGWDDVLANCWSCTWDDELTWLVLTYIFELGSTWSLSSLTSITSLGLMSPTSMFFIALINWVPLTSRFSSSSWKLSTKCGRQSTKGYAQGSDLSVDRCASYELDGDARHGAKIYLGSAAVRA